MEMSNQKIVRCNRSGVFFGEIVAREGREIKMRNARNIWFWSGAASLSELANKGVSRPGNCKFPAPIIGETILTDVIQILDVTIEAEKSLNNVPVWSAHD